MADRSEYMENRSRNLVEYSEGAIELRDALVAVPACERARLLAENPALLARIPTSAMRSEILLADAELAPATELVVREALHHPGAFTSLPAVIMAAFVPSAFRVADPTIRQIPLPLQGGIIPRHRIPNIWMRGWANMGRPLQASAISLTLVVCVISFYVGKEALAHDSLSPSSDFHYAVTWPKCSEGLRARTDFCLYSVYNSLSWPQLIGDLEASDTEEQALREVNPDLGSGRGTWPPDTLVVIWRGSPPGSSK